MSARPAAGPLSAALAAIGAPWEEALGPTAQALWPWIGAAGPLPARAPGAPVGLDGLGHRGPWERLVHGEWALLDVAPDAFLQRVADGELMFFARDDAAPGPPKRLVAWVDLGPESVGAPRLVLAAALVVLSARAAAHGVAFAWGVLGEDGLAAAVDAAALAGLRRRRRATPAGVPAGAQAAGIEPGDDGVLLLAAGPARVVGLRVLQAAPVGDGVAVTLDGRPVAVPVPAGPAALAALRGGAGPGSVGATDWRAAPIAPGFFFTPSGARLLACQADGLRVFALPVGAGGVARQVHRHDGEAPVRGLGWRDGGMVVLECPEGPGPAVLRHKGRVERFGDAALGDALRHVRRPGLLVRADGGGFRLLPPPDGLLVSWEQGALALRGPDAERWPLDSTWVLRWGGAAGPEHGVPLVVWVQEDGVVHLASADARGLRIVPAPWGLPAGGLSPVRLLPVRNGVLALPAAGIGGAPAARGFPPALWWPAAGPGAAAGRAVPGWPAGLVSDGSRPAPLFSLDRGAVLRVDRLAGEQVRAEGAVALAVSPSGAAWAWLDAAGRMSLVAEPGGAVVQRLGPP